MRTHFFTSGSKVGGTKFIRQLLAILKPRDCSQSFPANISKPVFKQVVHDWEDCQKSRIAYDRDIPKFSFLPSIPQYQHKICTRNLFSSDNQSIEKRGINPNKGLIHLSQSDIIFYTKSQKVIKVRVVPATALYFLEVANQKPVTLVDLNYYLRAGIELGIDNLVAVASNKPTFTPTIYDKNLKSINQGFNQRRAFLLSKFDQEKSTPRSIQQITFNRNKPLENYLFPTSSLIVKLLGYEKIIQLIIGTKVRGKQNIKLERKHHTFGVIHHTQLIKFITYKTELVGLKVIVTQAYYTNKCRFGNLEPVGKQESYHRKSGKRGWFRSFKESRINADVNAALNMIRKVNVNSPP
ncbi:zinc ribbon domain-containing protein [Microcoleus vaginatus]|uniref:zinc ribbon domain-containing protein n=1 Tax=Microcoleus vaginatus TaxID=119532 RepID=UPI0032AD6F9A